LTPVVALGLLGCRTAGSTRVSAGEVKVPSATRVESNILRTDYAGSAACEGCHAKIYAAWQGSPMHQMTRLPTAAAVHAPFAGETFQFKDDRATLEQKGDARFMRIASKQFGDHVYRISRVIGGRYREDYAGIEVPSVDPAAAPPIDRLAPLQGAPELILPVSFLLPSQTYRLKGYSVMVGERPGLRAGGVWSESCIFCHNTIPYFDATWGALYGRGAPAYQGEVVDRLLPASTRWSFHVRNEAALTDAVAAEVRFVGGTAGGGGPLARDILSTAIPALRRHFGGQHLLEVGIGCESCHGGSREHARQPSVLPDLLPHAAFMASTDDSLTTPNNKAQLINRTCARCHQVLFSRYPYTWEGGRRADGPGGSHITSGEGRDFLLSKCSRALSCTTCHDPHGADSAERLALLQTPAGNGVCTTCHDQFQTPQALHAHTHHDPRQAGGSCVACHMPLKNMGLGIALTRYHRIGSPTDKLRVTGDRPLECALCHADKTVGQVADDLFQLWGQRVDLSALNTLYGGLDRNVLIATVALGKPHEKVPAMVALGEHNIKAAITVVARQVLNPYPLVRPYALKALTKLTDQPCEVDLNRSDAAISADLDRCVPGLNAGTFQRRSDSAPSPGHEDNGSSLNDD
jgi:predicted CXXCH cytochrome family protein